MAMARNSALMGSSSIPMIRSLTLTSVNAMNEAATWQIHRPATGDHEQVGIDQSPHSMAKPPGGPFGSEGGRGEGGTKHQYHPMLVYSLLERAYHSTYFINDESSLNLATIFSRV